MEMTRRAALTGVSTFALLGTFGSARLGGQEQTAVATVVEFDQVPEAPFSIGDRVHKYVTGPALFIEGTDVSLSMKSVRKDLHLCVIAEKLRIEEKIRLPGRFVVILARHITFAPGASIDTSGLNGKDFNDRAAPGMAPGQAADNGEPGGDGAPGGDIFIVAGSATGVALYANGGNGGHGRSGGHGYNGARGSDGANGRSEPFTFNPAACTKGGPGGNGEDGSQPGAAGNGGSGGAAGKITLSIPGAASDEIMKSEGGRAGEPGSPSNRGVGGSGGTGGANYRFEVDLQRMHSQCMMTSTCLGTCVPEGNEGNGAEGKSFSNFSNAASGKAGASKTPKRETDPNEEAAAVLMTPSFADLIISRAELDYIGGDVASAAYRLIWINRICRIAAHSKFEGARSLAKEGWLAKDHRTSVLISQIKHSLNYFGADLSWVPPLKTEAFDKTLDLYFKAVEQLEKDSTDLDRYEGKMEEFGRRVSTASGGALNQIAELDQKIASSSTSQDELWEEVNRLNVLASSLGSEVARASGNFKYAVERKSEQLGGCAAFDQIQKAGALLTAVKVAGTVAGGGLPAFAIVGGALASFRQPEDAPFLDRMISVTEGITASVNDTKKRMSQIQGAWMKVKDAADALQPRQAPPLIKLDRESYRRTLDDFRGMEEAKSLSGLLDRYFAALDARNQGYANIEALVAQRNQMRVSQKVLEAEASRLEILMTSASQPGLTEFAGMLRRRLIESKRTISTLFAQQARAISYYQAEDVVLPRLEETRVSIMQDIRAGLSKSFLDAKLARGQAKQECPFSLSINRSTAPETFSIFEKEGYLPFVVAESNLADESELTRWWGVEIKRVIAEFEVDGAGGSSPTKLRGTLIHMGNTVVRGRDGKFRQFTHKRRSTNIDFLKGADQSIYATVAAGTPVGGDEEFIFPSPYGVWRLNFFENDVAGIDRSRFKGLRLKFIADGISIA